MLVTLDEAKEYLRVDFDDDNSLEDEAAFEENYKEARIAVLYTIGYLYEHREEADHHALTLTLRSLLFGMRKEAF